MDILVIRFSSLGDVVLAIGALRAIGLAKPDAHVTFVTKPKYRSLTENLGITLNTPVLHPARLLGSARSMLKGKTFDYIVDLHGSLRSVVLSRCLRAHRRLNVNKYTARRRAMVKRKSGLDQPLSVLRAYQEVLQPLGIGNQTVQPRLLLSADELSQAKTLRGSAANCLGIGWGARWATKAVPPRIWQSLLGALGAGKFGRLHVFGLETDRPAIESFVSGLDLGGGEARIECGHSIREVMTRLAVCDAFVSSDSGLMHIAAALGVPTIGLFGPTHPSLGFAPAGDVTTHFHAGTWCSPCHRHGSAPCFRGHRFCFDELDIAAIAESVCRALAQPWSPTNVSVSK